MSDLVERLKAGEPCLWDDIGGNSNVCKVRDARSGCICAEAADRIEALEAENASLSTWQCEFTDGKSGIVYGEGGGTYCAMARRVEALEAALRYALPLVEKYAWTQGDNPAFHVELAAPIRAALEEKA